jgi:hypothetical protein
MIRSFERATPPKEDRLTHYIELHQGASARAVLHAPQHPDSTLSPILYCSGLGTFGSEHRTLIDTYNSTGRSVLTVDHLRGSNTVWHPEALKAEAYEEAMVWALQNELVTGRFSLVTHSEGGINGPMAVWSHLKKGVRLADSIVLVAPAGLIEHENLLRLAAQTPKVGFQALKFSLFHSDEVLPLASSIVEYVAQNPLRALSEVVAISRAHNITCLRALHDAGIQLGLLTFHDDGFFPSHLIHTNEVMDVFDSVTELVEKHADHNALVFDQKSAIATLDILASLQHPYIKR